jgi:kynureninase
LSLLFLPQGAGVMDRVFMGLKEFGVIGDDRKPDVIRLAPTPLYNTEEDVEAAARCLNDILGNL